MMSLPFLALAPLAFRCPTTAGLVLLRCSQQQGFLTYVAAPVTFFIPDVLAAAALDAAAGALFLAPTLRPNETRTVLPLFFPQFWATVTAARSGSAGVVTLNVTKAFGAPVKINKLVAQPIGRPSAAGATVVLPQTFVAAEAAVLRLERPADWHVLVNPVIRPRVLSSPPGATVED